MGAISRVFKGATRAVKKVTSGVTKAAKKIGKGIAKIGKSVWNGVKKLGGKAFELYRYDRIIHGYALSNARIFWSSRWTMDKLWC